MNLSTYCKQKHLYMKKSHIAVLSQEYNSDTYETDYFNHIHTHIHIPYFIHFCCTFLQFFILNYKKLFIHFART